MARYERVLLGNDHVFGLRNVGTQPGTTIRHLSNLVLLPCYDGEGGDSNVDRPPRGSAKAIHFLPVNASV